jgi:hypothetical protein
MVAGFDEQALVAALKEMPALISTVIEPHRKGALQPLHALDEVRTRSLEGEVVMVSHHGPRMDAPALLRCRFGKCGDKRSTGTVVGKDIGAVIATIDDVVMGSGKLEPRWPWHTMAVQLMQSRVNSKGQSLTLCPETGARR